MGKLNIDAVILCGGLGTRLRSVVTDKPKVLAQIGKDTCLDVLARNLFSFGIRRLILATGYLGEQIEAHVKKTPLYKKGTVVFSKEEKPLGTGGALKKALSLVKSEHFFLANGDTLFNLSLGALARFHKKNDAKLSIVISPRIREDGGGVNIDSAGRIVGFRERASLKELPFMSDGIYLFEKDSVSKHLPTQKIFSLEYDFFPEFIKKNAVFGFCSQEQFFDIGTPERYSKALKHYTAEK